mmetsp:Transcript_33119/g.79853  ORF Transcript_33119/g.79853 Transcript_33119/m.79853 type:complete len:246 (-) Transcript_33119:15-752(-)
MPVRGLSSRIRDRCRTQSRVGQIARPTAARSFPADFNPNPCSSACTTPGATPPESTVDVITLTIVSSRMRLASTCSGDRIPKERNCSNCVTVEAATGGGALHNVPHMASSSVKEFRTRPNAFPNSGTNASTSAAGRARAARAAFLRATPSFPRSAARKTSTTSSGWMMSGQKTADSAARAARCLWGAAEDASFTRTCSDASPILPLRSLLGTSPQSRSSLSSSAKGTFLQKRLSEAATPPMPQSS